MAHVIDVARYILVRRGPMSAMKMQKLVYYSQSWHLVFTGEPLFEAPIEAWANGPVSPLLYQQHRGRYTLQHTDLVAVGELTESERQSIDAVLLSYGDLDAHQLSNLTHHESPWIEARAGIPDGVRSTSEISLATMQEFYEKVLAEAQRQS